MKIKTVRLELLRPGPPHNQLLSPLTSYIALCGDEPPETVHVPFEHYRLLQQIQTLRAATSPTEVHAAMTELREDVVGMMSGIRCLATALAEAHGDQIELVELELVLSASELSLIPFEIALYPGSPTRELAHREIIVTRRSRRVPRARLAWEHRPRVLIVAASPSGYPAVPIEAHVAAIREALAPWLAYLVGSEDDEATHAELGKFCVVLPNASEQAIQDAMQKAADQGHGFTHVHVLAHGGELSADDPDAAARGALREPRFGIILHRAGDVRRRDTLTGKRLFAALAGGDGQRGCRTPHVVTLASCDSGNVGSIVVPGASVAHDIHDGGVPLVVASQFPLSFAGSVVFVKRLYEHLLSGADPRCALRDTRRAVFAAATHDAGAVDWEAIVQYGALPADLPEHVYEARVRALSHQLDAAVSLVDELVLPLGEGELATAEATMRAAAQQLTQLARDHGDPVVDRYLARVHLRWAFILRVQDVNREDIRKYARAQVPSAADAVEAMTTLKLRHLRAFRDGLMRHYRTTGDPISLIEALHGNLFLGEPLLHRHALTAATQCIESLQAATPRHSRASLRLGLLYRWLVLPAVTPSAADLDALIGRESDWFQPMLDRLFADTPPTDFKFFSLRRACQRLVEVAVNTQVEGRARGVVNFLITRGVPKMFTAVVDWVEQADGGIRATAT